MDEFYGRLFEAAPAVIPLFAGTDLKRQKTIGAEPAHYPVVGDVLIASMAAVAGSAWQPEHERAWAEAFGVVAGAMLEGAEAAFPLEEAA